jgi:hypothetical protein
MWKTTIAVAASCSLLSGGLAGAVTLTLGTSTTFDNPPRNFIRHLDTDTLVLSDVTEVTGITGQMTDIAYGSSGVLYGLSFSNLYQIDEITGVATDLGRTLQFVEEMNPLAVDAAGTLYAASRSSSNLFTLDPETGEPCLPGLTKVSTESGQDQSAS